MTAGGPVTSMLERARAGDPHVADELMPLIYDELRRLAQHYLRGERSGHTLEATALVHEAYVRLAGGESGPWQNRAHFFASAAIAIRRILVEHARRAGSLKRGGDRQRIDLDLDRVSSAGVSAGGSAGGSDGATDERVLAVDEALTRLASFDPQKARIVELRFFSGMTTEQIAEVSGISPRTVAREWDVARAWLSRELLEPDRNDG